MQAPLCIFCLGEKKKKKTVLSRPLASRVKTENASLGVASGLGDANRVFAPSQGITRYSRAAALGAKD